MPADPCAEVRAIYAEVEAVLAAHPRQCEARTECCRFRLTGRTPMLTAGEALVAAQAVRAAGRKALPPSADPNAGRCPLLGRDGRCTIYAARPFGCRTHFCAAAGGMLPRKALQHLIHRLEAVAEQLGQTDPRPLESAVTEALLRFKK
ncbi:MAG: YkgJ family cysteine cluster protein [Verrucomicrobiales bacterium]